MNLSNTTILITGGTSGIGLAMAKAFAKDNEVIVTSRKQEVIDNILSEYPSFYGYTVDVSNLSSV